MFMSHDHQYSQLRMSTEQTLVAIPGNTGHDLQYSQLRMSTEQTLVDIPGNTSHDTCTCPDYRASTVLLLVPCRSHTLLCITQHSPQEHYTTPLSGFILLYHCTYIHLTKYILLPLYVYLMSSCGIKSMSQQSISPNSVMIMQYLK